MDLELEKFREIEELKKELRLLQAEEERIKKQLAEIKGKESVVLKKISMHSNEKYEADALAMVYEQRRGTSR